jgi:uncharacterized NAD-dependent epimerase/dehydratase family protein
MSIPERLAVLTGGQLDQSYAKTAHGILRYADRDVVAVVDDRFAGARVDAVVPYARRDTPVVASVAEAAALGATTFVVGVAPLGGALTPEWRAAVLEAIGHGMHVEAGLHSVLADDPELVAAAARARVQLRDLRAVPAGLGVPPGPSQRPPVRIVHSVGSECAIGKMSATLELERAARARGERSVFVPTGQTGVAIAGWGMAVDHVISDFVAGAAARLVEQGAERGDLLFVEGQGALTHPAYSGVTLGCSTARCPTCSSCATGPGRPSTPTTPTRRCARSTSSSACTSRRPPGSGPPSSPASRSTRPTWTRTPRAPRSRTPPR